MRNKFYNQYYTNERNEFRGNTGVYAHLQVKWRKCSGRGGVELGFGEYFQCQYLKVDSRCGMGS